MDRVRREELPLLRIDEMHRMILRGIMRRLTFDAITDGFVDPADRPGA